MARTRFPADRGLASRMLVTMFLLGLLYVVFVAILLAVSSSAIVALVVAGGFLAVQYFASDRIALAVMGAKVVSPQQQPELHGVVDRLCALADMPKPRVAIADVDIPNAFATGRSPDKSVVCVTEGLLRRLDEPELEAVLAHELSHIAHRDVAVMTVASFLGLAAGLVVRFAFYAQLFGGRRDSREGGLPVVLVVMLVSAVVYAISFLLTRALSRYRELSADRAAAMVTGRPSTLAAALVKISGEMSRIPTRDLRSAEPLNAFFFIPALAPGFSLSSLFSTHPTLERRLEQLARLEAESGPAA
ncbi:MAG TPA: zinc metalloprotease HtpX [Pseudonocardiaceae bacterium]|jgi:heat shock protein HtpX|nr:zinc metalloprotease HtpX [Pseudonocardiaceae bacterium]